MQPVEASVGVVGGGLVGAAIAFGLARRGVETVLLDERRPAQRASRGNFGLVWVQGKGLGNQAYQRLSRESAHAWDRLAPELAEVTGIDVAHRRPGGLVLAADETELGELAELATRMRAQANGDTYEVEILDHAGVAELVPRVGPTVTGGTYSPHDGHVDPLKLLRALHAGLQRLGGCYVATDPVTAITPAGAHFAVRHGDRALARVERVVVSAGLSSRDLGEPLGLRLPVHPDVGQIIVTERTGPCLDYPTLSVRQTDEGTIMLGYSHAEAGAGSGTDTATLAGIASRCVRLFPFLESLGVVRAWACARIMTPDGFPIYEQSRTHRGAFGFTCHSGVTLAAAHAFEVAGWVERGGIPPGYASFSSERFDV